MDPEDDEEDEGINGDSGIHLSPRRGSSTGRRLSIRTMNWFWMNSYCMVVLNNFLENIWLRYLLNFVFVRVVWVAWVAKVAKVANLTFVGLDPEDDKEDEGINGGINGDSGIHF